MKTKTKKISLVSTLVIGLITASILMFTVQEPITQTTIQEDLSWNHILGDADPGAGNSGFMYFMTYPHQGVPGTAYASNLSNATAYEYSDSIDTELTGETPHTTTFDFVMKFRVNQTVGYNVSSSTWETSWVRSNITCDFDYATDIGADSVMTIVQIATSTDYAYYHAYINNANAGYQITHDEKFNVTSTTTDGYY